MTKDRGGAVRINMKHLSDAKLIYPILITTLVSCLARFLFFHDPRPEVGKKRKILFEIDSFYLNDTLDLNFTTKNGQPRTHTHGHHPLVILIGSKGSGGYDIDGTERNQFY